ncbi:MAG: TrkH family potassium uptake protein [Flavobacteriales bacterium]
MSWQQFRERVNLYLFRNKDRTLGVLKAINIIVTLSAIGTMIWMYGFQLNPEDEQVAYFFIKSSFAFYVLQYLIKIVYDFNPKEFIRRTWFEGTMMGILIVEGLAYSISGDLFIAKLFHQIGLESAVGVSTLFIQVYFLIVVVTEFVRNSEFLPRFRLNPAVIFVLSFVSIILIGTFLLMLPEMTHAGHLPFVDSLFTATSATCVTGLLTVDVPGTFTFKGQFVILMLIKLGGLNIIAFGGFLSLMSKVGVGVRHHQVIEGFVARDNILSAKGMLGKVVLWTLAIEGIGAIAMYFLWSPGIQWASDGDRMFNSIFHSISAFNNAGISLFSNGFVNEAVSTNYLVHWVIILLIFFGSLGILAIFDLFEINRLRDRLRHPWKRVDYATRISLYFAFALIAVGAVAIYFFERNNTLSGHTFFGQITGAVFQSVAPRTAGYNTVDMGMMGVPAILVVIALMYIGAGSGSTGGGIKTSSLAVILADIRSAMTGQERSILWKRTISAKMKSNAYSIAIIYVFMNFLGATMLSVTESHILAMPGKSVLDLVFEQVSAFSTVGLSRNITSLLSETGKYVLTVSMFVGRVGTFTIAFALAGHFAKQQYRYPEADLMVG